MGNLAGSRRHCDVTRRFETTRPAPSGGLPPGLDPNNHPIICRHFFGIEAAGATIAEPPPSIRDMRFKRDVDRLHRLPARVTHELLSEIGAARHIQTYIEQQTAAFANIDLDALKATGGDRFPAAPIHEVQP